MNQTFAAKISANGQVQLLEPLQLTESKRALVTILDDERPRVRSKYAGAFSSGHSDTSERVEEVLSEFGFAK
jgi:hypothetical protein